MFEKFSSTLVPYPTASCLHEPLRHLFNIHEYKDISLIDRVNQIRYMLKRGILEASVFSCKCFMVYTLSQRFSSILSLFSFPYG